MTRLVIVTSSTARSEVKPGQKVRAEVAYTRYQFERRRDYAKKFGDGWLIFSARWGLLAPGDLIDPTYEAPKDIAVDSETLLEQLRRHHADEFGLIEILAGEKYVDLLAGPIRKLGVRMSAPLIGQGLGMGRQSVEILDRVRMGQPFTL